MTVSLADRGRYWCSVDTGGAAETQGDNLEYSLKLEVSSLLNKTEYLKIFIHVLWDKRTFKHKLYLSIF